jgi:hypothetical protein
MATTGARQSIEASAGTGAQEYQLKLLLASKDVDPGAMTNLMNQFGQDQDMIQKIINIQTNLSGADAGRAFSLASLFGEDVASQKQFLMNIESKEDGEAEVRVIKNSKKIILMILKNILLRLKDL